MVEYIYRIWKVRSLCSLIFPVKNERITQNFAAIATFRGKHCVCNLFLLKFIFPSSLVAFSIYSATELVQPNTCHIKSIIGVTSQIPLETTHDESIGYCWVNETFWPSLFHLFASFLTECFIRMHVARLMHISMSSAATTRVEKQMKNGQCEPFSVAKQSPFNTYFDLFSASAKWKTSEQSNHVRNASFLAIHLSARPSFGYI